MIRGSIKNSLTPGIKNDTDNNTSLNTTSNNTNEYKGKPRFTPPTLEEVQAYCTERNNHIDAQRFIDYYTSNGWKVGKNPMKDWKAAVRNWERTRQAEEKPKEDTLYKYGGTVL